VDYRTDLKPCQSELHDRSTDQADRSLRRRGLSEAARQAGDVIGVICPSGSFETPLSSPACENISLAPSGKSGALVRTSRPERGALRNVINAGRDAMDADALLTNSAEADGEVVWS
jgi:hypothetical protein